MWASVAGKPKPPPSASTEPAPVALSLAAPPPQAPVAAATDAAAVAPAGAAVSAATNAAIAAAAADGKLAQLVVDAGALIKGVRLDALAHSFFSVDPVMAEVRDKQARQLMGMLPFAIDTRKPSPEALKAVSDFARRTGDFRELSAPDLQILALTYMLEVEANGTTFLREAPRKITAVRGGKGKAGQRPCAFFNSAAGCRNGATCPFLHEGGGAAAGGGGAAAAAAAAAAPAAPICVPCPPAAATAGAEVGAAKAESGAAVAALSSAVAGASLRDEGEWAQPTAGAAAAGAMVGNEAHFADAVKATFEASQATAKAGSQGGRLGVEQDGQSGARKPKSKFIGLDPGLVSVVDAEEDDGTGWVNSDNMGQAISGGGWAASAAPAPTGEEAAAAAAPLVSQRIGVGCITTDFAMQNVLLQMGLQLMSADGMKIRRLKQWSLKCEACFEIVADMDRIFCPKCGTHGLKRVSVSVDRMGRTKVHTRKQQKHNTKGQIYSIPKNVGGRFDGGLLLREDQMLSGIWQQKTKAKAKALESFGGLDVLDKVGITVNQRKDIQVGFGKKNPNSRRGRERRGKKTVSETSGWW